MHLAVAPPAREYERHRPERTTLYAVVRDNLETLYGAIDEGALDVKVSKYARKELEAYLECGLLCRGFARFREASLWCVQREPAGRILVPRQRLLPIVFGAADVRDVSESDRAGPA